jgi:hypothetical protein
VGLDPADMKPTFEVFAVCCQGGLRRSAPEVAEGNTLLFVRRRRLCPPSRAAREPRRWRLGIGRVPWEREADSTR